MSASPRFIMTTDEHLLHASMYSGSCFKLIVLRAMYFIETCSSQWKPTHDTPSQRLPVEKQLVFVVLSHLPYVPSV